MGGIKIRTGHDWSEMEEILRLYHLSESTGLKLKTHEMCQIIPFEMLFFSCLRICTDLPLLIKLTAHHLNM